MSKAKLSERQVADYKSQTSFRRKELQQSYRQFSMYAPNGELDREGFRRLYEVLVGYHLGPTLDLIFDAHDLDKNGTVSFREWIIALDVLRNGSVDDRLRWTFGVYDTNNDGKISPDEMLNTFRALRRLSGSESSEECVARTFQTMDVNNDGEISLDEFMEGCKRYTSLLKTLEVVPVNWVAITPAMAAYAKVAHPESRVADSVPTLSFLQKYHPNLLLSNFKLFNFRLGQSSSNPSQNDLTGASTPSYQEPSLTRTPTTSQLLDVLAIDNPANPLKPATVPVQIPLTLDISNSVSLVGDYPVARGGSGELFVGTHKDHGKVALKKLKISDDNSEFATRQFLREVDIWREVPHRYVLPFLGTCKLGRDIYAVSPFVENGDLQACLKKGLPSKFKREKLLYEVAEALAHLHYRGIVHGDVKAKNVLLSNDGSALLCDFGLTKTPETMTTSTGNKGAGSTRWMAPEVLKGESKTPSSDVYSFGITIAEVLSERTPFYHIPSNITVILCVVNNFERPPKDPSHSPEGKSYAVLWDAAEMCWDSRPQDRPNMAQVMATLFRVTRESD